MNFNSIKETKAYNIGFENGFNKAQNDIKDLENTMLRENAANEKEFFKQKARDAKLREILEDTAWCLREYVEGFQTDGKGKSTLGMAIGNTKKALLLVEKEAKTK